MATSFNDSPYPLPNFAGDGAQPRRWPEWFNPDNRRTYPSVTPPWRPLPQPQNPFEEPPRPFTPFTPMMKPQSNNARDPGDLDAIDWLLGALRGADQKEATCSCHGNDTGHAEKFAARPRPWSMIEPPSDLLQTLPFGLAPAPARDRAGPEDLLLPMANKPSRKRSIQPPIFFPFY
jgi:hypothetical protein